MPVADLQDALAGMARWQVENSHRADKRIMARMTPCCSYRLGCIMRSGTITCSYAFGSADFQSGLLLIGMMRMQARPDGRWKTVTGRYKSIMAVVTPCRSDRSTLGLSPFSHLADGRIHLVLVKDCSVLQYLKFMASIPVQGWTFFASPLPLPEVVPQGHSRCSLCLRLRPLPPLYMLACE